MAVQNPISKSPREGSQKQGVARSKLRDIIVMGGSAGAIEVIAQILSGLPADISAAIFVVVHIGPDAPNYLGRKNTFVVLVGILRGGLSAAR